MKNKYYRRSRISEAKFREIIRYFSLDFTANNTAKLTKVSRNTINKIYDKISKNHNDFKEISEPNSEQAPPRISISEEAKHVTCL
mgnify:CR=1 FL=1